MIISSIYLLFNEDRNTEIPPSLPQYLLDEPTTLIVKHEIVYANHVYTRLPPTSIANQDLGNAHLFVFLINPSPDTLTYLTLLGITSTILHPTLDNILFTRTSFIYNHCDYNTSISVKF